MQAGNIQKPLLCVAAGAHAGRGILYMTDMPGKSCSGMLPPLTAEQVRLADRPEKHIAVLTGMRKPFGVDA